MIIPTSELTEEKLRQADAERVEQAYRAAFRELYPDLPKHADYECSCGWCQSVNQRFEKAVSELAFEMFQRLN